MPSALPPADHAPYANRDLLTGLLHHAGVRIAFAPLIDDDAHWDTATATLILRAGATPEEHAVALSEFWRCGRFGEQHSRFTPPPRRHLQVVR